ncbi:AlpA family transcriptional regulator [Paraburkholderia eburnea]|uniref:AlpA family transcriptional regulator n=1 Tax=Paraburkholderia eburnea TaxID=1189126 RepID=A0A2S4M0I4_9BURK|nr:AlpA family phage regulatory protein [Paraburkholderia eburnea]POR48220.1 AlpA family transcriptional regulator [Paraburkholderia eburnea]PRZ22197.1 AlpA family transcriptional regulator [Paraburkholderia eburnea]
MATKILHLAGVVAVVGVKKNTIYKWLREKRFPAPVRLGENSVGWREADIEAWLAACESTRTEAEGVRAHPAPLPAWGTGGFFLSC